MDNLSRLDFQAATLAYQEATAIYQESVSLLNGSRHLSGVETGVGVEVYKKITALSATVVTLTQAEGETTLTSLPIPAGTSIYGNFTSITMVSGDILAYIA